MTKRQAVHEWIDDLPDDAIEQVEAFLEQLQRDRLKEAFANAPLDDEELTPDDVAALEVGLADLAAGRVVADADLDAILEERIRGHR
ncbi:MAG: hypothetical protein ACKVVT_05405 [Dehalococcoidia bacterium]